MSILEEAAAKPVIDIPIVENVPEQKPEHNFNFVEILKIPTGPGSVEEYKDSPLNFDRSDGLSRILRGFSGIIGADVLRSAVVDIIFGIFKWVKDKAGRGVNIA